MDIKDIEKYGVDPSVIKQYIEKAKNGDKIVAVAGEFSSGKSTFINAFLDKKGFIPSARIECTPALLEFVNSDNDKIEISYKVNINLFLTILFFLNIESFHVLILQ